MVSYPDGSVKAAPHHRAHRLDSLSTRTGCPRGRTTHDANTSCSRGDSTLVVDVSEDGDVTLARRDARESRTVSRSLTFSTHCAESVLWTCKARGPSTETKTLAHHTVIVHSLPLLPLVATIISCLISAFFRNQLALLIFPSSCPISCSSLALSSSANIFGQRSRPRRTYESLGEVLGRKERHSEQVTSCPFRVHGLCLCYPACEFTRRSCCHSQRLAGADGLCTGRPISPSGPRRSGRSPAHPRRTPLILHRRLLHKPNASSPNRSHHHHWPEQVVRGPSRLKWGRHCAQRSHWSSATASIYFHPASRLDSTHFIPATSCALTSPSAHFLPYLPVRSSNASTRLRVESLKLKVGEIEGTRVET